MYGVPGKGRTGSINLDVGNNVEMKWRTKNDSIKKISIIDELGANISYNLAAKKQPWSNLSTRLRLKLTKSYTFSFNAVWATYAYEFNDRGQVVVGDRTEWSYGRFGRFQGMSHNLSYTFNNGTWDKIVKLFNFGKKKSDVNDEEEISDEDKIKENTEKMKGASMRSASREKGTKAEVDDDGYMPFKLPWSFSVSYGIVMAEDRSAPINIRTMRYP
jgi:hypothetical protein